MASTYESPETVVISEAGPTVAALKGVSDVFSTGLKKYGEMRNAEAVANKKRQAELAKAIYIDPEKYFERIQENEGSIAVQDQALELFRKNTELSLQVRSGIGGSEVLQKRNQTIKKLNQLVGYAEAETTFKQDWIANGDERIKNMSNQGGASVLDEQFWSAANILSGIEDGKVETTYVNGAQYYTFTGKGLKKPYKVPSVAFLSKELPKVPQWDKSVKNALIQIGLIDDSGKLTMDARKMTREKYQETARETITKVAAGFAKKDLHSVNSIVIDIMGEEYQYPEGRGTGQISPEFEGSVITPDYQKKFKNSTGDYGMANNVPRWYGIDPKPVVKSDSRKFNETIGITPEELYKEFTENPATAWSQYLDTKLPEYDANTNIIIVPEIKEDKEKGIKPKAEESFQLSTTAGAKRFYTVLLSKYPGIGGSKEGLGFKNKFLKLIEEKMGKVQSDATNTTNQLQPDITQGRNFNTGKD
jgi:hypothetical protein